MPIDPFPAIIVSAEPLDDNQPAVRSKVQASLTDVSIDDLADAEVLVRIEYSSINYKDVLAAQAHPGVARNLPLIAGITASGEVVESSNDQFKPGDKVFVAHAKFGTAADGGFADFCRVPADWLFHIPENMTTETISAWGTAGFTAAQSVDKLLQHDIKPENGPVIVSGSTGGVGIFSVMLLHKLGFEVVAITGKADQHDWLKGLGASTVIKRSDFESMLDDATEHPLLKSQYAAAIDTVGGNTLAGLIKMVQPGGVVTACGMVGGNDLSTTVFPFILRGVTLCGVDSANIARQPRQELWNKIASQWQMDLTQIVTRISLAEVLDHIELMSQSKTKGRLLVELGTKNKTVDNNAAT